MVIGVIAGATAGIVLGLLPIELASTPIPPSNAPIMILCEVSTIVFTITGLITVTLLNGKLDLNLKERSLEGIMVDNKLDLNSYTKKEEKDNTFMNITTFNSIPVIKHPPIPNWKDFNFILIEKPLHGDLLPGPGLQFLYGPTDGYTGYDTFRFGYSDSYGRIKGHVTVNVVVSPIPVFNISTPNRIPRGVVS